MKIVANEECVGLLKTIAPKFFEPVIIIWTESYKVCVHTAVSYKIAVVNRPEVANRDSVIENSNHNSPLPIFIDYNPVLTYPKAILLGVRQDGSEQVPSILRLIPANGPTGS